MLATRNDSILLKCSYTVFTNRVEFWEYNHKSYYKLDSLIKVY